MDNTREIQQQIEELKIEVNKIITDFLKLNNQRCSLLGLLLELISNFELNISYPTRKYLLQQVSMIINNHSTDYDAPLFEELLKTHSLILNNELIDKAIGNEDYGI